MQKPLGITLIEILVSLGLLALIGTLATPIGIGFLDAQNLDKTTNEITAILHQARQYAVFQKNDSSFGVAFLEDSYVLFQGAEYIARLKSEDRAYPLQSSITVNGMSEVVFAKQTGAASQSGTITISSKNESKTIHIHANGVVERA